MERFLICVFSCLFDCTIAILLDLLLSNCSRLFRQIIRLFGELPALCALSSSSSSGGYTTAIWSIFLFSLLNRKVVQYGLFSVIF